MRQLCALVLAALLCAAAPAPAQTLFAAFDNAEPAFQRDPQLCGEGAGDGLVGYLGTRRVCADLSVDRIAEWPGLEGAATREVVLLTSRPGERTLYRAGAGRGPLLPLADLARPLDAPLTIRGQRGADGMLLVWLRGLDLIDTICDPSRVADEAACRAGEPVDAPAGHDPASWERRYEIASLVLEEQARTARMVGSRLQQYPGVTAIGPRHHCVALRRVSGLVLRDLAFEDCWLTAVTAVNSRRIELRGAVIHGSTAGMLAFATEGLSAEAHSYVVADTHWIQSPAAYRADVQPCEAPHLDLACAVDLWDDLPWGVTHHHLWRPLNGGLFVAYNIAGNVLVERNLLERAFNGVRITSETPRTGRNVTIQDNRFRFIRDNAIEPEERAENWVFKHNILENVHAWISTDGVSGQGFYIFGNVASYDPEAMPGTRCREDVDWARSPFFVGLAGDAGRYELLDISYDPTSVECRGHYRGAILKTGDDRKAGFPYLHSIAIFHNSWQSRSPLWGNKHASPLVHVNNLIEFTGCGLDGPWHCRQIPTPDQYCNAGNKRTRGRVGLPQYWTDDGAALVADCVSLVPGPAEPDERAAETRAVAHRFCRDLYNRSFGSIVYGAEGCAAVFAPDRMLTAASQPPRLSTPVAGCRLDVIDGTVSADCSGFGDQIGAVGSDGRLYDRAIEGAGYLGEAFRP